MKIEGKIHTFGDNVDTDVIIPARYLNSSDKAVLAAHCMEDIDIDFSKNVKDGDLVVGGYNFGSGSSREHAPIALKASGVQAVVAKSFARIFYRNAINIGLFVIESEQIADELINTGSAVIDYDNKTITANSTGKIYNIELPGFVSDVLLSGGLIEAVKKNGGFNV